MVIDILSLPFAGYCKSILVICLHLPIGWNKLVTILIDNHNKDQNLYIECIFDSKTRRTVKKSYTIYDDESDDQPIQTGYSYMAFLGK